MNCSFHVRAGSLTREGELAPLAGSVAPALDLVSGLDCEFVRGFIQWVAIMGADPLDIYVPSSPELLDLFCEGTFAAVGSVSPTGGDSDGGLAVREQVDVSVFGGGEQGVVDGV